MMKRTTKAAMILLGALALAVPVAGASPNADPSANDHGKRVSAVARAATYASGRAKGAAVSAEARKNGEARRAEAKAKAGGTPTAGAGAASTAGASAGSTAGATAGATATAGPGKGRPPSEPGRLKSQPPG